jgi:hypothetical protein
MIYTCVVSERNKQSQFPNVSRPNCDNKMFVVAFINMEPRIMPEDAMSLVELMNVYLHMSTNFTDDFNKFKKALSKS